METMNASCALPAMLPQGEQQPGPHTGVLAKGNQVPVSDLGHRQHFRDGQLGLQLAQAAQGPQQAGPPHLSGPASYSIL